MVDYLDPEIRDEGVSAEAAWHPAVEKARIPTYEGIKSLRKYFPQYSGIPYQHKVFPCWLYNQRTGEARLIDDVFKHQGPDEPPKLIKRGAEIAKELGCEWRKSTQEERGMGAGPERWAWAKDSEWRPWPAEGKAVKYPPGMPGEGGKHLVSEKQANASISPDMITAIVAAVSAQFADKTGAPPQYDQDRAEFEAFKAWRAAQAAHAEPAHNNALHDEKAVLIARAEELGLDVDKRWGAERIRAEIEKAAA